jgi:hypothetical protein
MNHWLTLLLNVLCWWPLLLVIPSMRAQNEAYELLCHRLHLMSPFPLPTEREALDAAEIRYSDASNRCARHTLLAVVAVALQMIAVYTWTCP